MIDTHAHLTDSQYDAKERTQIIDDFDRDGLQYVVNMSCDVEDSIESVNLAHKYDKIYSAIGVHPENVDTWNDDSIPILRRLAQDPKVVAIGEIGLDYHYTKENIDKQKEIFIAQLRLAHECHLPVVLHNRDSIGDMLSILENNSNLLSDGGVLHCFSESIEVYERVKKLGLKVGFGGVCTFKNARKTVEVIERIDLNDFVVETDSPYLTPEPYRGKVKNQPKYVRYAIEKIAQIRKLSVEQVERLSTQNALDLYKKIGAK